MKVLVVGDLHFGQRKRDLIEHSEMISQILKTAERIRPENIVILGDIHDHHEKVYISAISRASKFLSECAKIAKTFVLVGNHDISNNRQFLPEDNSLVGFSCENLKVISRPYWDVDNDFVFCPFVPNGRFTEALNLIENWKNASCIFAHQEFFVEELRGITSPEGDRWDIENPLVISGHIHEYLHPQANLIYVGTPMQNTFGESTDKALFLATFEDKKFTNFERISLNLKPKITIETDCDNFSSLEIPEFAKIKIVISCIAGTSKNVKSHPKVKEWRKQGHVICCVDRHHHKIKSDLLNEKKTFTDCLLKKIGHDDEQLQIFRLLN